MPGVYSSPIAHAGSQGRRTRGTSVDVMAKYDALLARLASLESVLVAYSGGVDSTLLAVAAHAVLGDRALAVLAVSDVAPSGEIVAARELARELGLTLLEIETSELVDPAFRENTSDRCYHCKTELFDLLVRIARARGLDYVADGSNVDDLDDHRPGRRAGLENGVISPLQDAGLTKHDIRELARTLGLSNWDKPSMACLASRIPFGTPITEERLAAVASAEERLRDLGLVQVRVRAHGDVARVEVDPKELERAWTLRTRMSEEVRAAGFPFVSLDLDGYRTGSMNPSVPMQPDA